MDYALKAKSIQNKPVANQRLSKTHLLKEYAGEVIIDGKAAVSGADLNAAAELDANGEWDATAETETDYSGPNQDRMDLGDI